MKHSLFTFLGATALAILLSACGGGSGNGGTGNGGGGNGGGAGGGTIQGDISTIAGNYTVTVALSDCDPADNDAMTTYQRISAGVCRVTSTQPSGTVVVTQKDLLPAGRYRLTVATDGSISIGAITRACTGTCIVASSVYTIADAVQSGMGANVSLTQIIFNTTVNPKTAVGYIYGTGLQISGTTLATGEAGVIVLE